MQKSKERASTPPQLTKSRQIMDMAEVHVVVLAVEATELLATENVRGSGVVVNPHDPARVESLHVLGGSVQLT